MMRINRRLFAVVGRLGGKRFNDFAALLAYNGFMLHYINSVGSECHGFVHSPCGG
jgi:hypothetical protein